MAPNSQSPDRSPVNTRPVRLPPWAAGASPTTRTSAFGSPNPGTGRPQYSQSRNAARFVRATCSRYRTRRGHRRHATTSEATRSKLSEDTGHPDSVRRQKRAPEETTKSIGCPPPPEAGIIVSKSRTIQFSRVGDLSQAVGPETQMFPAYPPPRFTQWTTREVLGFFAESLFLISHTGTHVDAPFHFEPKGRKLHELRVARFIAPGHVLDLRGLPKKGRILPEHLRTAMRASRRSIRKGDAVLLRTRWWERHRGMPAYLFDSPGLTGAGADLLLELGVGRVGIDTASIDHPDDAAYPAHHALLGANVP